MTIKKTKSSAAKKTVAKKSVKKSAVKKAVAKKPASKAKKTVAKKPATKAKKTVAKKPATKAKKTVAKKPASKAKKIVAKKPATKAKAKKAVAKKPATKAKAKKAVAKKPATKAKAKKAVAKKPATKAKVKKASTKKPSTKAKAKKAATKKPATKAKAKKAVAKKPATKAKAKKAVAKKPATKAKAKKAVAKKPASKAKAKKAVAKKPASKVAVKKSITNQAAKAIPLVKNPSVAREGEAASNKATPIAFSFDDVEALVATRKKEIKSIPDEPAVKKLAPVKKKAIVKDKPVKKRVLGAASLADILGFNPAEKKKVTSLEDESIPKKWKKYYKLLLNLRQHVSDELDLHTSDTLQHASRDEGDRKLEADAGTDAFDRDFALSLVSSEQEALNEVEEAILRIKEGTYGVCEVTGKTISKDRLAAVPFARYSVEGQAEFEKNQHRKIERIAGGLFADSADAPKITSDDDD